MEPFSQRFSFGARSASSALSPRGTAGSMISSVSSTPFRVLAFLVTYLVLLTLSHRSTLGPGDLGMRLEREDGVLRVSWLMPAGQAWHDGVRPGMRVVSFRSTEAEVIGFDGQPFLAKVVFGPVVRGPMKWSLWALSAVFAALGSVVVLRRPDHRAARLLGLFSGFTAIALAVSPSASGVHPVWSLVVMFSSLIGVAAALLPFALALTNARTPHVAAWHVGVGIALAVVYGVSVVALPRLYPVPRTALALYLATSIFGAVLVLAIAGRRPLLARQQSRIILLGILLGTAPFLALTLLPETLGGTMILPAHVTVLPTALIPALAVLAITQLQLLEIRRVVHRGLVYSLTTLLALLAIVLVATLATPMIRAASTADARLLLGACVALGIAAFYPLRATARRFVDRFLYKDATDPNALIEVIHENLAAPGGARRVEPWLEHIREALRLEAAVLFTRARITATAGARAQEVLDRAWPELEDRARRHPDPGPIDLPWKAESFLYVPLQVTGQPVGHLLLGPKEAGEVFLPAERRMVALIAPVLALALHEGQLSERLVEAEEAERARLARDLHDGPLQKSILLGGGVARAPIDPHELARELTLELRELCSRLRPAILDDLGLAPALEWLLEQAAKRFGVRPSFALHGVDELERFPIGAELALFRITQEAINNAVKHGRATSLDVSLTRGGGALCLTVEDNGVGFAHATSPRGLGIAGMHGRARQLGGSVDIRSVPGVGTSVAVRVPCSEPT